MMKGGQDNDLLQKKRHFGLDKNTFLAAGLPASSGRQYYSRRSCSPSRMFTPLPVMSVNGTIFLINNTCSKMFQHVKTC